MDKEKSIKIFNFFCILAILCFLLYIIITSLSEKNIFFGNPHFSSPKQKATLSLSNPPYYNGYPINVTYSVDGSTSNTDWVGLLDENNLILFWSYTNGTSIGVINDVILPNNPGRYIFKYYIKDSYDSIGSSISFIVNNKPPPSLRQNVIDIARTIAPQKWGTSIWDEMMGGRIDNKTSWPGAFKYYSDNYGTTCGVIANYILEKAGAPPQMINRGPRCDSKSKTLPCFEVGGHISKIGAAASKLGIMKKDLNGVKPGDLIVISQDAIKGIDPSHIATVLYRDGNFLITADGGSTCNGKQCSVIAFRTILPNNRLKTASGAGSTLNYRVDWDFLK